jgi:hypothetical protein
MVQLDVGNSWGDKKRELPDTRHALGAVRGFELNQCLDPLVVQRCSWCRRRGRNFSAQGLDDASGRNVPRTPEHDVERLAALVVTGLRVWLITFIVSGHHDIKEYNSLI